MEGKWRVFTSLADIGLTIGEETPQKIAEAMPARSTLIYSFNTTEESYNRDAYPRTFGLLVVTKYHSHRITFECPAIADQISGNKSWTAYYYNATNIDIQWSGWREDVIKTTSLTWINLAILNGFVAGITPKYAKDNNGIVYVTGTFGRSTVPAASEKIALLPVGFRPTTTLRVPCTQASGSWSAWITIDTNGYISFSDILKTTGYDIVSNVAFSPVAYFGV